MVFERYIFKNLLIATIFITFTLTTVIFLTQSLRFLELIIQSGASGAAFWILTILALPRFFEVIIPVALMASVLFVYTKLILDSELIVMRAMGSSPMRLARPALILSGVMVIFLWVMTMWAGPVSLSNMQKLQQMIKAQYSTLLFQEGVFTSISDGLTVFIRERTREGEMRGILIHDSRDKKVPPVTVIAARGIFVVDENEQKVIVYDGMRQDLNPQNNILNRLDFDRYTIELPIDQGPVRKRWREPDERTFMELLRPDKTNERDMKSRRDFKVEAHRRIVSPLLAPCFVLIALASLLLGPTDRIGQTKRIIGAVGTIILLQGLYLGAFSLSVHNNIGLFLMYLIVFAPMIGAVFMLSKKGERTRRQVLYKSDQDQNTEGQT